MVLIDPNKMTHDMLLAHRDKEWADSRDDSAIMREMCADMRRMGAEQYRKYLLARVEGGTPLTRDEVYG